MGNNMQGRENTRAKASKNKDKSKHNQAKGKTRPEEHKQTQLSRWTSYPHFAPADDRLGKYYDIQNQVILNYARVQVGQIIVNERANRIYQRKEVDLSKPTTV